MLAPVAVVVLAAGGYGLSRVIGPGGQVTASSGTSAAGVAAAKAKSVPSAAASDASTRRSSPHPVRGAPGPRRERSG